MSMMYCNTEAWIDLEEVSFDEQWRPVLGFEGRYEVSNKGQVRSWVAPLKKVMRAPKILRPTENGDGRKNGEGYWAITLYKADGKSFCRRIHALVCEAFYGPRPSPETHINHKNGIKKDNRIENLEYCSISENRKHSYAMGLESKVGIRHHMTNLSELDIMDIRQRHAAGETQSSIGRSFNLTQSSISRICTGSNWGHIRKEVL